MRPNVFHGPGRSGIEDVPPPPLVTHRHPLDDIEPAYRRFGSRSEGVLKVVVTT